MSDKPASEFEKAASEQAPKGLLREFWEYLGQTKKWWLLPILVVLLLFGLLVILAGTGAAPFIYTLF
jgi:hypothetical protein